MPTDEERLFDDANERFHGDVLDEKKMDRLNRLRAVCRAVSDAEPSIKFTAYPFSDRSQNGMVILDFPKVMFCTSRQAISAISQAFALSDDITTTTLAGNLRISFGVHNMWSDFHYDE